MTPFRGVDYYGIEDLLSSEEKLIRDTVRNFISDDAIPVIERHYREGTFPLHLVKKMADLGLFGPTLPARYGGSELGAVAYGLMMQELERGDSSIRSFASVQSSLVMYPLYTFGSDRQKEQWLPRLAKGEAVGCFGLTEPDFGSNPSGMKTRAEKKGNTYILNGAKMWITNGSLADVAVVWAKLDGEIR
jgi:glutaryl-CoA dehydrogenase